MPISRLFLIFGVLFLLDIYAFQALRTVFSSRTAQLWATGLYWAVTLALHGLLAYSLTNFTRDGSPRPVFTFYFSLFVLFYTPKLLMSALLLLEDFSRMIAYIYGQFSNGASISIERREWVSKVILGIAAIPFGAIIHGLAKGAV